MGEIGNRAVRASRKRTRAAIAPLPPLRLLCVSLPVVCGCLAPQQAASQAAPGAGPAPAGGTTVNLGTIPVTAPGLNPDGSTPQSGGMYVPAPTFGPFGPTPAQNLPFSTNSFPQTLIRDQQARTLSDVARNDPSYGIYAPSSVTGYSNYFIRGFPADDPTNNRIDGLPVTSQSGILLQNYERIDIYKGLPGLLYGFANPGGVINYVSKQPLDAPLTEVSGSYISNTQFFGAADVSRRFGPGNQFGIRINLSGGGGDGPISQTSNASYVGALALDWKPAPNTRLWFNSSYSRDGHYGLQPGVALGAFDVPTAPGAGRFLGVPFSKHVGTTRGLEGGFEAEITPWLSTRAAIGNFRATRDVRYNGATLENNLGDYTLAIDPHNHWALTDKSAEVAVSPHFTAGIFTSRTDFAFTANEESISEHEVQPFLDLQGRSNLYKQTAFADPNQPIAPGPNFNSTQDYRNYVVRETLDIGRYLTLIGAVSHATVRYSSNDTPTGAYSQDATSPSAGIVIKPTPQLSFYGSYIKGLQPGSQAGETVGAAPVLNAFATLPAFVSTQYEVGAKYQVTDGLQANLALFRISRPSAIYQPANAAATAYNYTINGEQVNRGVELTTAGRITRDLTVFGGVTLLDPRIDKSQDGLTDGKRAIGIPRVQGNLFAEYAVPPVPGLTALGGVYYTGSRSADSANTRSVPSFVTLDLGFKYQTMIANHPLTARLYVQNVTGADCWVNSVYAPVLFLGDPRTYRFDLAMRF